MTKNAEPDKLSILSEMHKMSCVFEACILYWCKVEMKTEKTFVVAIKSVIINVKFLNDCWI